MKNVIITGSSGMVGSQVLKVCLNRGDINKVTIVTRRKSGIKHPKLVEVIHDNFLDFSSISGFFKNQDICIYCVGVYTGQVPNEEFTKITVDYTKAFAQELKSNNDKITFCFLSGAGADTKEKSKMIFARDKGKAENILLDLNFDKTYIFRPGYIYPTIARKEPNFTYKVLKILYKPILSKVYPNIGITSERLAEVMVDVSLKKRGKIIFENNDIRKY